MEFALIAFVVLGVAVAAVALGRVQRQRAAVEAARDGLRQRVEERERELRAERRLRRGMEAAWRTEREWSRELRGQVHRLHDGARGASGDVRELVLQAAIELVGAQKGLMLSRHDEDGDGDLDFVLARGFEHDPERSQVAQRFAREVLDRDQIVREDDPPRPDGDVTEADAEIESLVAIPVYVRDRFDGVIVCANRSGGFEAVGDETLLALGDHAGSALQHGRLRTELRDAHRSAIRVLAEACSERDPVLHRESGELALRANWLARELGFEDRERDVLVCAAMLRGVGNLALPERLALKPGPLTPEERALIELHPRLGFNVIAQAPALRDVATTILYHHERYDGDGYPARIAREDIPRTARALSVLEAYAAMVHERPYRTPWPLEEACDELVELAGSQFDPKIAITFVQQLRRMPKLPGDALEEVALDVLPVDPTAVDGQVLDRLGAAAVDGLTLLPNQRSLLQAAREAAADRREFVVVLVQLDDLAQANEDGGHPAGDKLIVEAARAVQRAAARLGGAAYRASGRRLAVLAPLAGGDADGVLEQVRAEFMGGPRATFAVSAAQLGERGDEPLTRARHALRAGAET